MGPVRAFAVQPQVEKTLEPAQRRGDLPREAVPVEPEDPQALERTQLGRDGAREAARGQLERPDALRRAAPGTPDADALPLRDRRPGVPVERRFAGEGLLGCEQRRAIGDQARASARDSPPPPRPRRPRSSRETIVADRCLGGELLWRGMRRAPPAATRR